MPLVPSFLTILPGGGFLLPPGLSLPGLSCRSLGVGVGGGGRGPGADTLGSTLSEDQTGAEGTNPSRLPLSTSPLRSVSHRLPQDPVGLRASPTVVTCSVSHLGGCDNPSPFHLPSLLSCRGPLDSPPGQLSYQQHPGSGLASGRLQSEALPKA